MVAPCICKLFRNALTPTKAWITAISQGDKEVDGYLRINRMVSVFLSTPSFPSALYRALLWKLLKAAAKPVPPRWRSGK